MVAVFCSMYTIVNSIFYYYFILLVSKIYSNLIYLFKLQYLLHNRIDPTVEVMRKKQPQLKYKKVQRDKTTSSIPPIGAPSWCLNRKALEKFNRATDNIPLYDHDTDEDVEKDQEDRDNNSNNTEEDEENFGRKKKNKTKYLKKRSKHTKKKTHKSKKSKRK